MSGLRSTLQRFWPRTPMTVRDAYAIGQYEQLAVQIPLLYAALALIVLVATLNASPGAPDAIRYGIPAVVIAAIIQRSFVWLRRPVRGLDPALARQHVRRATIVSGSIASLSSIWCYFSWLGAPAGSALYFPLFMAMGSLATIVCVSMIRCAAMLNIVLGLLPIALVLTFSGNPMASGAGISIVTTAGFLAVLIMKQYEKTIALLLLHARMRELADTDPLTGLINRRALRNRLNTAISATAPVGQGPVRGATLMLLDLDGFKPVNDRHGHGAGDEVLCQVARRLSDTIAQGGIACRMGGDEFALLLLPGAGRMADAVGTAVLAALARPYQVEGKALRVGASLGTAIWPQDGATLDELYRTADHALYVAKSLNAPGTRLTMIETLPSQAVLNA